jgi:hypothetical protein
MWSTHTRGDHSHDNLTSQVYSIQEQSCKRNCSYDISNRNSLPLETELESTEILGYSVNQANRQFLLIRHERRVSKQNSS